METTNKMHRIHGPYMSSNQIG